MKFLCDQMLSRIGRWLRAAGYDTEIIEDSISDSEILQKAEKEKRILLSRDKRFFEKISKSNPNVIWLESNKVEDCIKELSSKLSINWLLNPFSRCLVCNQELRKPPDNVSKNIPKKVKNYHKVFLYCNKCKKVYWMGSHTKKMLNQLEIWNR